MSERSGEVWLRDSLVEFIAIKGVDETILGGSAERREKGKVRTLRETRLHALPVPEVVPRPFKFYLFS